MTAPGDGELRISGRTVQASAEGLTATMQVGDFVSRLRPPRPHTGDVVLPQGVHLTLSPGNVTVFFWEIPPQVHLVRWIAADSPAPHRMPGRKVCYELRELAMPYLIIAAVFMRDGRGRLVLTHHNEAYFRTAPLKSPEDTLCLPALLNVSRFDEDAAERKPLAWICTQYVSMGRLAAEADDNARIRASLTALKRAVLETGFNYSSEVHELTSCWSLSARHIEQVADLDRWEALSRDDPLFVLDVPWIEALWRGRPISARRLAERAAALTGGAGPPLETAADLARVVFNHAGGARSRREGAA